MFRQGRWGQKGQHFLHVRFLGFVLLVRAVPGGQAAQQTPGLLDPRARGTLGRDRGAKPQQQPEKKDGEMERGKKCT